jgi:LytTr DNA-binding domain-containing protein
MLKLTTGPDSKELAKQGYNLFKDVLAGDEAKLPEAIRQMEEARKADETYVPNLYNLARAYFFDGITFNKEESIAIITLHLMLVYFISFTLTTVSYRAKVGQLKIASLIPAQKAGVIAGVPAVATFVLMLSGYWSHRIPLLRYFELAAMMTSVPYLIAVAYRQYQFPFMDAFIREVISGIILLVAFATALSVSKFFLWTAVCAVALAYLKAPLTRWVERKFVGYEDSIEDQEQRIATAIRGLTQLDEFNVSVSEIIRHELEAEWVEINATTRSDAAHRFELPGSALELTAHHHQKDVIAFESDDRLVFARTAQGRFVLNITMKELEDRVAPDLFCRVHKQAIVQLSHAREVHSLAGGHYLLKLDDGSEVQIGRNYSREFRARFG